MSSRKNRLPTPAATLAALPATAMTDGVVQQTDVIQAAGVGTHQDDNLPGDIAAAVATGDATGLIEDGAVGLEVQKIDGEVVVEPVIVPRPNGDEAGDTAAAVVTGTALGYLDHFIAQEDGNLDSTLQGSLTAIPPESETVTGEAGDPASLSAVEAFILDVHPDWSAPTEEDFKRSHPRTFEMLSAHEEMSQPVLRVTPKTPGFRRGGFAHPAGATDYPALSLRPSQIEAILGEPELVVEIV